MPKVTETDMQFDPGLVDDFDGVLTGAIFEPPSEEYRQKSGSNEPWLMIEVSTDELEQPAKQGFGIGSARKWKIQDKGTSVVSEKKPELHAWTANSRGQKLVDRLFTLAGDGDKAKGVAVFVARGHYMTEAEFYLGINAHWKREPLPVMGGGTSDVLMPVVFHGFTKVDAKTGAVSELTDDMTEKLVATVVGCDDKEAKKAVLSDAELKGNKTLLDGVFKRGLLKDLVEQGKLAIDAEGKFTIP